jgi:hypothetical protein
VGRFPRLWYEDKLASFHCAGKYALSKAALNSCARYCIPIVGSSLRILPVMRLYPGDYLVFRMLMMSFEAFEWWFELVGGFQELDNVFLFSGIF